MAKVTAPSTITRLKQGRLVSVLVTHLDSIVAALNSDGHSVTQQDVDILAYQYAVLSAHMTDVNDDDMLKPLDSGDDEAIVIDKMRAYVSPVNMAAIKRLERLMEVSSEALNRITAPDADGLSDDEKKSG